MSSKPIIPGIFYKTSVLHKREFYFLFLLIILLQTSLFVEAQNERIDQYRLQLNGIDTISPGLNETVSFSMTNVPIQELVRNLAQLNQLNITIEPSIQATVTNNFAEVKAKELILFLCQQYNLQLDVIGTIISITKHIPPKQEIIHIVREPRISYDTVNKFITMDLKNDSLYMVTKKITELTGYNIILTPDINNKKVSGFIDKSLLEPALKKFAQANELEFGLEDGFVILTPRIIESKDGPPKNKPSRNKIDNSDSFFEFKAITINDISVNALNIPIFDIVSNISNSLGLNYFIYAKLDETRTIQAKNITYLELLNHVLSGSTSTYKNHDGVFIIGERSTENLRSTKVIQLKQRSVIDLINVIPGKLKEGVEIKEFSDLNSLLISGSLKAIEELESFIFDIDKVVPMILIEVMIVDSRTSTTISTGINAGLGDKQIVTGGSVMPGIDLSVSSGSINKLISSFNGFGWFNLGKVTPNFYFSIKALENSGIVKVRSTPKLSTLNGHEATITIGNTEYYLEETNSVIGTQNPQNIKSQNYKPVNVNFTLRIKPIVSGNEQITLNILVEQSDFTARISKEAPPGSISRSFTSQIRIRNEEMVLLGGLEEKKISENATGLPLLSRIPILKWLFSSRLKDNSFDKLNIFIKPTIIY